MPVHSTFPSISAAMKTPSLDLFIFADALGWTQAQRRDFLADLFPHRAPCETIFGYSASCDPSILTGKLPAEHGHFSFFVYDPRRSPFRWAKLARVAAAIRRRLPPRAQPRQPLGSRAQRIHRLFPALQCAFRAAAVPRLHGKKGHLSCPAASTAASRTIFEHWERSGVPWMRSDWRAGDARNVQSLKDRTEERETSASPTCSPPGLDAAMHAHTTDSAATDAAFAQLERWLREIHALAREHYDEVRLHLFSDHGMTNTTAVSAMMPDFERAGFVYGRDYAAVWDSTMARFWFPGGDAVRDADHRLAGRAPGGPHRLRRAATGMGLPLSRPPLRRTVLPLEKRHDFRPLIHEPQTRPGDARFRPRRA